MMKKRFLHVGCGPRRVDGRSGAPLINKGFDPAGWDEVRLDIDQTVEPDIVGSMTEMSAVESASMDALFSSHNIEHLYPHEIPVALREFRRVLKSDGFAVITCPDLQSICALVAQDKLSDVAYVSQAGPIAALDMLYGLRPAMAAGNLYMAHRSGFTLKVLSESLQASGFAKVVGYRRPQAFDLWVLAMVSDIPDNDARRLAGTFFP